LLLDLCVMYLPFQVRITEGILLGEPALEFNIAVWFVGHCAFPSE